MQWEELTSVEFTKVVKKHGVCLLAMGVVEKHSEHLPLGTDFLNGHRLACLAAEKEPAVVFPPFYLGQIYGGRCFPGTITLRPRLLLEVLLEILDEIGRNGFKKIILVNAHGGNYHMIRFLVACTLAEEKPYSVYIPQRLLSPEREKEWKEILETNEHLHACECETSISMANHPELVKMDQIPEQPGTALGRTRHLPPSFTGISWYGNYPDHYAGDARSASQEKGLKLRKLKVDSLAEYIAAVKKDEVVPTLQKEFFRRERDF